MPRKPTKPAKPARPLLCVYCQVKIPPRRRSGPVRVGSYFCSNTCEAALASKLGLDLDTETMEVIARGAPGEILVFFGLKAGRLIWDAYQKRKAARPEPGPDPEPEPDPETPETERARLLVALGLPATADLAQAETEYRRLAKLRHPDVTGGSVAAMQELNAQIARLRELFAG